MLHFRNAGKRYLAPLVLLLLLATACNNKKNPKDPPPDKGDTVTAGQKSFSDTALVTVAALLPSADGNSLNVVFNEKA
ncbi:MAG: hypothetical protein JNM88_12360, partial [Chitinophagaceae bacterium]|nr:hypothetical protein [Chitinophagaceae bacterium]